MANVVKFEKGWRRAVGGGRMAEKVGWSLSEGS